MPVVLVTGASRGMGRQVAITLSRGGHSVIVNYRSSDKEAASVVSETENALAVRADVGDIKQVTKMAAWILDKFGRIDAVINNAGIIRDNLLLRQSEAEWDEVINTNLKGCFNITKSMTPLMIKSGGGHIVNISSYSGIKGRAGQPAYSASKAALKGFTLSCAAEFAAHNIRVNLVLPGYMITDTAMKAKRAAEEAEKENLLKRLSSPLAAAGFIAWLLTTEDITGQVFNLDGRIM